MRGGETRGEMEGKGGWRRWRRGGRGEMRGG